MATGYSCAEVFLNYMCLDSGGNLVKRDLATDLAKDQQYSGELESVH